MVDKVIDLRKGSFVASENRGAGFEVKDAPLVGADLAGFEERRKIQANIVSFFLHKTVKGAYFGRRNEGRSRKQGDQPAQLGIPLDQGKGRFIDHIIHLRTGEEVSDGGCGGLGHDGIADMAVRDDKEAAEGAETADFFLIDMMGEADQERAAQNRFDDEVQEFRTGLWEIMR